MADPIQNLPATDPRPLEVRIRQMLEADQQGTETVTMTETRKSWVFLTQHYVYKLKKRVRDDLQDLTSQRARLDNSLVEVDLNRRLARPVYLGVVRLTQGDGNGLCLEGAGQTIDWLVKMQRMPAERMLDAMIAAAPTDQSEMATGIDRLAGRLIDFYRAAPRSNLNASELATILQSQHNLNKEVLFDPLFTPHHTGFAALIGAYEAAFDAVQDPYRARASRGWVRECHGDMRPEHLCLTNPPLIFDCLEFNRNLRLLDPFQELSQLGLETDNLGATWIKPRLIDAVASGLGDKPTQDLLDVYEVAHALLRMRLCLAHLLVPKPRKPQKWLPLALRYCDRARRLLHLDS